MGGVCLGVLLGLHGCATHGGEGPERPRNGASGEQLIALEADKRLLQDEVREVSAQLTEVRRRAAEQADALSTARAELDARDAEFYALQTQLQAARADAGDARAERVQAVDEARAALAEERARVAELEAGQREAAADVKSLEGRLQSLQSRAYADGAAAVGLLRERYATAGTFFDGPRQGMQVGDEDLVTLTVSLQEGRDALRGRLEARAREEGRAPSAGSIRVHEVMRANLVGTRGLEVRSLDGELDRLLTGGTQAWRWSLTAVAAGRQTLNLTLVALIEGEEGVDVVDSWSRTIEVEVAPGRAVRNFLSANWQWIWSALIVPVAVLLWEMLRRARARSEKPA
jgi:hypothetical protein